MSLAFIPCPSGLGRSPPSIYLAPSLLHRPSLAICRPSRVVSLHGWCWDIRCVLPFPGLSPLHSILSASSGPDPRDWCVLRLRGFTAARHRLHGFVHFLPIIVRGYFPVHGGGSSRSPYFLSAGPARPHCRAVLPVSSFSFLFFRSLPPQCTPRCGGGRGHCLPHSPTHWAHMV